MWSLMTFTAAGNSEAAVGDSFFTSRSRSQVSTISKAKQDLCVTNKSHLTLRYHSLAEMMETFNRLPSN